MENQTGMDRRRLFQSAGLAASTVFLPSLLGDKRAYAAPPPKRIVFFNTMHGPPYKYWKMRRPGLPDEGADWEFPLDDPDPNSFSEVLRLLHPHRKDLLLLEGLSLVSGLEDDARDIAAGGNVTNNHGQAAKHNLTAAIGGNGPSVDQIIANQVAVAGRLKYLYYATNWGVAGTWVADLAGKRVPNGEAIHVGGAVDKIFGTLSGTPAPAGPPSAADISRTRESNLLKFVQSRYDALMPKLSTEDRAKLTLHRNMLADLGAQVTGLAQVTCNKPGIPGDENDTTKQAQDFLGKIYPTAAACDLTRVMVYHHYGFNDASWYGGPSSISMNDAHAQIAHNGEDGGSRVDLMRNYYQLHTKEFLGMIEAFKSVPEGNGTMLDNSLLVWMPELANGIHDYFNMRVVIAGSGGGALRTGRYLRYGNTRPNPYPNFAPGSNYGSSGNFAVGPGHSHLLVSLMQAMGVSQNSIGVTQATGRAYKKGTPIDLTGPLPNLV